MGSKSYARPLLLLAAVLAGAGIIYLALVYANVTSAAADGQASGVPLIPIKVPNPAGGDSTYKTVGPFAFTSQNGVTITRDSLTGKIWVADVFFTTCQGICPKLSTGLQRVKEAFTGDPEVRLVSFTVDPEYDSLPVLREYAGRYGAVDHQWHLLTGEKAELYRVETEEFFFSHTEDEDSVVKFVHDGKLRLVDKEGRFRGKFYDGTDPADVDSLIVDIKRLKNEYAQDK